MSYLKMINVSSLTERAVMAVSLVALWLTIEKRKPL